MNHRRHMTVLGLIGMAGFILFWFLPQFGAAIFLPALGAYFGARQSSSDGASQPARWMWGGFFALVAIPLGIRLLYPEQSLADPTGSGGSQLVLWIYLGTLAIALFVFGYLAYRQRAGRRGN